MIHIRKDSTGIQHYSRYNGEKTPGDLAAMRTFGYDPNDFVKGTYDKIMDRCATLYSVSSLARAAINKPLSYIIGPGLFFKSLPNYRFLGKDKEWAREWGKRFTELLHYEKISLNWYKKQSMLLRERRITGDSLLLFDWSAPTGLDLIVAPGSTIDQSVNTNEYTLGIKHDSLYRRTGFFAKLSKKYYPFVSPDGTRNAIQCCDQERPTQMRGWGVFFGLIARVKNNDRMWDAILQRMVLEANIIGYSASDVVDVAGQMRRMATSARSNDQTAATQTDPTVKSMGSTQTHEPGSFLHLDQQGKMEFLDMKAPSNNFGLANEWTLNDFAMYCGYGPQFLLGKYVTSYTSHKGEWNDTWTKIKNERQCYISTVENSVNEELLKRFIADGEIDAPPGFFESPRSRIAALQGKFMGPTPGAINPLQEVNAQIKTEEQGYVLKSEIAALYGSDFWNQIDEYGEEQDAFLKNSPQAQADALKNAVLEGE